MNAKPRNRGWDQKTWIRPRSPVAARIRGSWSRPLSWGFLAFGFALLVGGALAGQERLPLRTGWSFARAAADGSRPEAAAYKEVTLPAAWESHEGAGFDGVGWYRRTLPIEPRRHSMLRRLELHGAATATTVFWNGTEVGRHLGAWTPFRVPLPASHDDREDLLEIRVDEKVGHDTQGFHPIIQPHFGGLWQDVVLCSDTGPVLDRFGLLTFGEGETLRIEATALQDVNPGAPAPRLSLQVRVLDGASPLAGANGQLQPGVAASLELAVPGVRRWSPGTPNLYRVELTLRDPAGRLLDREVRRVGFRELRADGRRLLWNGAPLQVRGMLHWGYEPPLFAPNPDAKVWRRELEDLRARGFNLVKACLWLPPQAFFDIADEVGMLVWQEYPTWHPKIAKDNREGLRTEFAEFHRHDRSHPSVAFRSLTCETGHSADLEVIQELYDQAKRAVPNTLVVDDSSWISWNRVHDFWDDHPYGNNRPWPGKLRGFDEWIQKHGEQPLLLGECITADTWVDLEPWRAVIGNQTPWWAPRCLADQARFETWFWHRFGGPELARLLPDSLRYGLRNRQYQIERLRQDLPEAGYVVSVLRDFTLARMGLYDPHGEAKWSDADFAWQRDTMLCLATERDCRAFTEGEVALAVRCAHAGAAPLQGRLRLTIAGTDFRSETELQLEPGAVSAPVRFAPALAAGSGPRAFRLEAELRGTHPARSGWDLWVLPRLRPEPAADGVQVVTALDAEVVARLRAGGKVLLRASDKKRSLRTRAQEYYRGAPFAPAHPLHARVPRELLLDLQTFDLEGPRVLEWDPIREEVDPILAVWDTHDLDHVRSYALAYETRVGDGRLLATSLDLDRPAGAYVLQELRAHLASGPAPRHTLSAATLERLAAAVAAEVVPLEDWTIRFDPKDQGLALGFERGAEDGEGSPIRAGAHWESQGFPQRDGIAWYRTTVTVPESVAGKTVHAVLEGVDDSYRFYLDGVELARFGDPATKDTVWLQRTVVDLTGKLRAGVPHRIVLRVVDHAGSGGVWKPVYLTTGRVDRDSDLVH